MKMLNALEVLTDPAGEEITTTDEDGESRAVTLGDAVRNLVTTAPAKGGDDAVAYWRLAQKVMPEDWDGSLEDAEHKLVVRAAEANGPRYVAYLQGMLLEKLREA